MVKSLKNILTSDEKYSIFITVLRNLHENGYKVMNENEIRNSFRHSMLVKVIAAKQENGEWNYFNLNAIESHNNCVIDNYPDGFETVIGEAIAVQDEYLGG